MRQDEGDRSPLAGETDRGGMGCGGGILAWFTQGWSSPPSYRWRRPLRWRPISSALPWVTLKRGLQLG